MPYVLPYSVKKTSLYLSDDDNERLNRLSAREHRSMAEIVREAIATYETRLMPDRNFSLAASWEGDGTSIADLPEEESLEGFGS
ncbi:MAG TPA: CopG family transcriptional regulator [Chloroflexota bacterium]|jgi:predicted DNA-binding protein|nr:CopG family transcriptional regulator [Chloroflexota bacterium]